MTHNKSLKFTLWNATSIKNKTIELQKFLSDHNTDIAIITETGLTSTNKFKLINYNIHPLLPINPEEGYS